MVTLALREKEFKIKSGTTLLAALEKADILPESVIATRDGEMILEDEILHDGDIVKLIAVISGGQPPASDQSSGDRGRSSFLGASTARALRNRVMSRPVSQSDEM